MKKFIITLLFIAATEAQAQKTLPNVYSIPSTDSIVRILRGEIAVLQNQLTQQQTVINTQQTVANAQSATISLLLSTQAKHAGIIADVKPIVMDGNDFSVNKTTDTTFVKLLRPIVLK